MVVFHSYAEFPEGSYRNPRVYVEPTCLDELHWIVTITTSLRRHYRLCLVWAIILKLPCSVRWVTLIIMYPDVWHTYLHLLPKISRRKVIYIYISQRWMVWVRVKSCQVHLSNYLYHCCLGSPPNISIHFPFYFQPTHWKNMVPLCSTMFHYIFHCAPIKSPLYRHICFIPHVLQFRTFFIDQNHFFCLKPHILIVTRWWL